MLDLNVRPARNNEHFHDLLREYQGAGNRWPAEMPEVAEWLIRNNMWRPSPNDAVRRLSLLLARAMREEVFIDPQGRRVRKNHAVRWHEPDGLGNLVQHVLWQDMSEASPEHMSTSFQQRRRALLGGCKQLKTDVESYNDNQGNGKNLVQISFDFTEDLQEMEQPTTYEGMPEDSREPAHVG